MNKIEMNGYARITKQEARKRYDTGHSIYLVPCKCRIDDNGPWIQPYELNNKVDPEISIYLDNSITFEHMAETFIYYNCNNEVGLYPAYYEKVDGGGING